jgi:hypothetical protein
LLLEEIRQNKDTSFIYGNSVDSKYKIIDNKKYFIDKSKGWGESFSKLKMLEGNFIPINTFIIRSSLAQKCRFLDDVNYYVDWAFLLQAISLEDFKAMHINEPVSEYRRTEVELNNQFISGERKECWDRIEAKVIRNRDYKISGDEITKHMQSLRKLRSENQELHNVKDSFGNKLLQKMRAFPLLKLPLRVIKKIILTIKNHVRF